MCPLYRYRLLATGVAAGLLIALLSVSALASSSLKNISTRADVLTQDKIAIAGFIIHGSVAKCVVVRGRGPSVNIASNLRLADPTLTLKSGSTTIATNDNWQTQDNPSDATTLSALGLAPGDSLDAAIFVCLDPGPYTALLRGVGGGTGVGIVEVIDADPANLDCGTDLSCAVPDAGKVCISGRIIDAQTSLAVEAGASPDLACGAGASGGPCDLSLEVYDGTQFAASGTGASPLGYDSLTLDGCGRFRFDNIAASSGNIVIGVDDANNSGGADLHVYSGTLVNALLGARVDGVNLRAVKHTTDSAWTSSAGGPFGGDTFGDKGAVLGIFLDGGAPVSGVTMTRSGSSAAADDWYFDDADSATLSSIDAAQSSTGVNGAGLMVNSSYTSHSGTGGEPGGCFWPSYSLSSLAGTIMIKEFPASCP